MTSFYKIKSASKTGRQIHHRPLKIFFLNLYQMGCHLVTTYQQGKIVNHIKSQSTIFEPVATKPSLHDMLPSNQQLKADQTLQHQTYQLYVRRAS